MHTAMSFVTLAASEMVHVPGTSMMVCLVVQACLNERPSEGLGEVLGGLRGVMEAEALQLNTETQALHALKVACTHARTLLHWWCFATTNTIMLNSRIL